MKIWSAEISELERFCESVKGQLPDLEKELEKLISTEKENNSESLLIIIILNWFEELKRQVPTD
jgi:hypothetical protein